MLNAEYNYKDCVRRLLLMFGGLCRLAGGALGALLGSPHGPHAHDKEHRRRDQDGRRAKHDKGPAYSDGVDNDIDDGDADRTKRAPDKVVLWSLS